MLPVLLILLLGLTVGKAHVIYWDGNWNLVFLLSCRNPGVSYWLFWVCTLLNAYALLGFIGLFNKFSLILFVIFLSLLIEFLLSFKKQTNLAISKHECDFKQELRTSDHVHVMFSLLGSALLLAVAKFRNPYMLWYCHFLFLCLTTIVGLVCPGL